MPETVVVVDDDAALREAMVDTLASDGFGVLSAGDGVTALHVLGVAPRPCVVIVDLVIPGGDGAELARTISALGAVRVLCVTAGRGALPEGCHAMLRKPFDASALLAAVRGAFATLR